MHSRKLILIPRLKVLWRSKLFSFSFLILIEKLARNPVGVPRVAPVPVLEIWADDQDRFSFEDSDRFEEDSLCSWSTEPESICNNWRGWKKPFVVSSSNYQNGKKSSGTSSSIECSSNTGRVASLCELTARCVASHIPFELVEHVYPPVPEQLQLRIAFWSFPDNEEDIRLYSCLANSSADEFTKGEALFKSKAVKDPLQIGFHLSATVVPPISFNQRGQYNVAVVFDRRRITSCNCTCNSSAYWCSHIVAVCLHRIHHPKQVCLRAPVSESLSRLQRDQLQKFAQYLISELPQQILPTAQKILDELLSSQPTAINSVCGAPDPTAGASIQEQTSWYLDEKTLHENIKKILVKFCVPAPIVFSDVNYLGTTAPPAAAEWTSLLRPLRGREPEGMWNLLSIVREMFKRNDRNALPLLQIITEECMSCEQIMVWWFNTKVALHIGVSSGGKHGNVSSNTHAAQHACASLCDEVVVLWRLAVLNPGLAPSERTLLCDMFKTWHSKTLEKVEKGRMSGGGGSAYQSDRISKNLINSIEVFSGFKPAIAACQLDWEEYPIPGVTYQGGTAAWLAQPYTCFRNSDSKSDSVNQVSSSQVVLFQQRGTLPNLHGYYRPPRPGPHSSQTYTPLLTIYPFSNTGESSRLQMEGEGGSGNRSSVSSEGFCENDQDQPNPEDDSIEAGVSSSSSSCCMSVPVKDSRGGNNGVESGGASSEESDPPKASSSTTAAPPPRRLSKDDSLSSDSQQSGDEFYMYYYDPKTVRAEDNKEEEAKRPPSPVVASPTDPWDVLFARAEGLHAHGHTKEACILGVRLAEELLANPPNLMLDLPVLQSKGKRKRVRQINPLSHQLSVIASDTLAKCGFLCTVLAENPEHYHLAFKVGLFGLEMPRPPATTKPLEVKLFNQESELVTLLKRIPLGQLELDMIRERAQKLKEGSLRTRGEALLPLTLASYILDSLTMPEPRCQLWSPLLRHPSDELLGFEAATAALGLKANVSEADHPLLCEGTRRQRGDLAVVLLVHYKSDPEKIAQIMDKLLDREVHQLMKTPLSPSYYTSHPPVKSMSSWSDSHQDVEHPGLDPLSQGLIPTITQAPPLAPGIKGRNGGPSPEVEAGTSKQIPGSQSSPSPHVHPPPTRTKESSRRFKGKRAYPSIPNQPSEAGAHFMFELAKTVLLKAGGSSSTSLFTQASASQPHHSPHRALHMCAFQLGLYALGLHNCVSPNWLSRTYSSHVSWITGQAMEIGAPAISFLQDTWEGHLTPPEAANMADRASRGCDRNMTRAAAELALSCLPHAHALNPNEICRAISQCKEQSERMLEQSCLTVENAAKGGGVYPEVLFQVAKYWHDLYIKHSPQGEGMVEETSLGEVVPTEVEPAPLVPSPSTMAGPGPYGGPPPPPPAITAVPYSLFAVAAPPHFHPHHQLAITAPQMYHIPTPQFQYFPSPPPPPRVYSTTISVGPGGGTSGLATLAGAPPPTQPPPPPPQQVLAVAPPPQRPPHHHNQVARGQQYNSTQIRYLLAAYRVGMLAMETIARRVHDDRPNAKYARNPPYGEDVKWLLRVAQKLGTQYLHQFCVCVVNSIVSPFVLHDVAIEAAHYLARGNPSLLSQHLRSSLTPLVQKCQQMYIQCLHQKLYHLSSAEYDDFLSVVMSARKAFQITPEGSQQFKEWLQSIRRSKSCKKELWAKINVLLPQTNGK